MNVKKKIGLSAATAILGISLIGGGSFAYFSDSEVTNNTFTAGTLDINLKSTDDSKKINLNIENMKPGDWKVHQIRIYNGGSLEVKDVKLRADYTVTDANGDNGTEDFADHILVNIMKADMKEVIANWVPLSQLKDSNLVVANDLKTPTGNKYQTNHRQTLRVDFKFNDNGQDQNIFQGDQIDFKLSFEASQKDGELK